MYRTGFWTLWEKARVGCSERTASKHVYYLGWKRSPAQVGCMRQVLGPGALGRARGIRWRGRWEGGSGWGIHVNPWLILVNVWQKPLQYCKVISLQLIKKNPFHLKSHAITSWVKKRTKPENIFESYPYGKGISSCLSTKSCLCIFENVLFLRWHLDAFHRYPWYSTHPVTHCII